MADTFSMSEWGGSYTFNFRNAPTYYLLLDTWRTAPAGDGLVSETFQVAFTGTDSAMRTNVEKLLRATQIAEDYFADPTNAYPLMVSAYSDGESDKWALIYDIQAAPVNEGTMTPLLGRGATVYQVSILRDAEWEAVTPTLISLNNLSCDGGDSAVNNSGAVYGSRNGRMHSVYVSDGPATDLYRLWIGVQPYDYVNDYTAYNASFDASWEVESGTAVLGSFVNDATASPAGTSSNCLDVTSVPSTIGRAWWGMLGSHAGANSYLYKGEWLVLARIKVDAGVVGVQLRAGAGSDPSDALALEKQNEMIYVSNTGWRLIELGKVSFPPWGYLSSSMNLAYCSLSVYIQQISGTTGHFKLDQILLIPARHFVKAYKARVDNDSHGTTFYVRIDGKQDCVLSDWVSKPEATFIDWAWPYTGGMIVAAGEAENAHTLTDTIDILFTICKRNLGHLT